MTGNHLWNIGLCYTCIARRVFHARTAFTPRDRKAAFESRQKTGRTKSFYAREAILRHIEDLEDLHLARKRLARRAPRIPLEALEQATLKSR